MVVVVVLSVSVARTVDVAVTELNGKEDQLVLHHSVAASIIGDG